MSTPLELARAIASETPHNSHINLQLLLDARVIAAALIEAAKDTERLDWLERSTNVTASEASAIVSGFVYERKYRGSLRAAIDAAKGKA